MRLSLLMLLVACGPANGEKQPAGKAATDDIPPAVLEAARKRVPGFEPFEAKQRERKAEKVYKLDGMAGDRLVQIWVDLDGNVLRVNDVVNKSRHGEAPSPARLAGRISHPAITESSGIIASRRKAGVFWTHNDQGSRPVLYAIDGRGKLLGEHPVAVRGGDWEDIAADAEGNLYIGDLGNNDEARRHMEVHRLREPEPAERASPAGPLPVERTWRLNWPREALDCEALFIHGGQGYVISKRFDNEPAGMYRFRLDGPAEQVLEKVGELPIREPVTAADLSPDGQRLAVLSTGFLQVFDVAGNPEKAPTAPMKRMTTPRGKFEGACFAAEGIVLTCEGREVYVIQP